jgi:outer membrane protein assembly factor BamB
LGVGPASNVLWSVDVPWSPSSPSVLAARIFLTTFSNGNLETRAYSTASGKLLWSRVAPAEMLEEFHPQSGSPATATPASDGHCVVSYFGSSGLFCYDLDGQELWQQRLPVAKTHGNFGSGTSPLLAGGCVILNRDLLAGSSIMAFDIKDGHKLWETPRPELPTSYSTPILWSHDGITEAVVAGSLSLRAYDLKTGSERWRVQGLPAAACTTPVLGNGWLFFAGWSPGKADAPFPSWQNLADKYDKNADGILSSDEMQGEAAFIKPFDFDSNGKMEKTEWDRLMEALRSGENSLLAIKPGGSGDVTASHVAWKASKGLPYVPSPLYYEGRVYLIKDGGMFSSFDARTGEPAYLQERLPEASGTYYASPVAADGRIYVASLKGKLTVVKAGGVKPEILHQADFGEPIDATPALVGDRLYLRTRSKLMAFGESKEATVIHFDDASPGKAPAGWTATQTGSGQSNWTVEQDDTSPSSPNMLRQSGVATYPVCIKNDTILQDGFVEVKFKAVTGKQDQAGGVIWRCQDSDNYYVARANALEDNVTLYHTIKGKRVSFKNVSTPVKSGSWHTLRVDFKGNQFTVSFNGNKVIEAADGSLPDAGKVGLWTKADSVTLFDDFAFGPKQEHGSGD